MQRHCISVAGIAACYRSLWRSLIINGLVSFFFVTSMLVALGAACVLEVAGKIEPMSETQSCWKGVSGEGIGLAVVALTMAGFVLAGRYTWPKLSLAVTTALLVMGGFGVHLHTLNASERASYLRELPADTTSRVGLVMLGVCVLVWFIDYMRCTVAVWRLRDLAAKTFGTQFDALASEVMRRSKIRFARPRTVTLAVVVLVAAACICWLVFAVVAFFLAWFMALAGMALVQDGYWGAALTSVTAILILMCLGLAFLAGAARRAASRRLRAGAGDLMARDVRPPILLLRSFADDGAKISRNQPVARLFWRKLRLEEAIGRTLARLGPFVAIGKPGEKLPLLGSYRFYFEGEEWQSVVRRLVMESQLITMVMGETQWLKWELDQIVDHDSLPKLLLIMPPGPPAKRAERWAHVSQVLARSAYAAEVASIEPALLLCVAFKAPASIRVYHGQSFDQAEYDIALLAALSMQFEAAPSHDRAS